MRKEYKYAVNGKFMVASNKKAVSFANGNLQYQASTDTWRFAPHQYDIILNHAGNTTPSANRQTQEDWIDLLYYGANGINNGQSCYQPWKVSTNNADFYQGSISGTSADWGYAYSAVNDGQWRTLTRNEWEYVISGRDGERFAKATVHGVPGLILIPDNKASRLNQVNNALATYTANVIGEDWDRIYEINGYVFLPCGGYGYNCSVGQIGKNNEPMSGFYHTSTTYNSERRWYLQFKHGSGSGNSIVNIGHYRKSDAMCVRLVCDL